MSDVTSDQLREAVERLHGCKAVLGGVEAVHETFQGQTVWKGTVHVYGISGHPKATVCFAWSSPIEGSESRQFYAVLAVPPILTATDAVRASFLAERGGDGSI